MAKKIKSHANAFNHAYTHIAPPTPSHWSSSVRCRLAAGSPRYFLHVPTIGGLANQARHNSRPQSHSLSGGVDEAKPRALITELKAHGQLLVVVDRPATIGALPVAVACDGGVLVAYLPGLAMRRIADLHAREAKTSARDAAVIAEAARSMPHTLRTLRLADEPIAELTMLCGFDDDLAAQITRTGNSIRGLLTQIHPVLHRGLGHALIVLQR
ncbi:hypothetical protein QFZ91_004810 [Paraburkholderia sp. JPY419]